jgi:UDP:flavonoid glycosyltransferase YjiC (YdhE family)
MRILFTAVGLAGHFFPLVPLAWACRAAGHDVLVASSDEFSATVAASGLPVASCGPAAYFPDLVGGEVTSYDAGRRRYAHGCAFGRIAARSLPGIRSLIGSWGPRLVVSDRAEYAGPLAAASAGVPHVEFHWGVAALSEFKPAATVELGRELAALGLDTLPAPAGLLNPWPPSLRLSHASGHQSMRYVPYNGNERVPEWLVRPGRKPTVCLTVGTVLPRISNGEIHAFIVRTLENLARLDVEVVVAVDDDVAASWPALPPVVRHAGWLPLSQALGSCDVSIHHGGQGTSLTALQAGKPQLVLPHFDDQLDNASAVAAAGAGLSLLPDDVTPEAVAGCCRELLGDQGFADAAEQVAAEMAAQPSPARLVGLLEDLAA